MALLNRAMFWFHPLAHAPVPVAFDVGSVQFELDFQEYVVSRFAPR